jgi:hypothetical protein
MAHEVEEYLLCDDPHSRLPPYRCLARLRVQIEDHHKGSLGAD